MCNKITYLTPEAAARGLLEVQTKRKRDNERTRAAEARYYQCSDCDYYHLTSKSKNRKSTRRKRPNLIFKVKQTDGKNWGVNNVRLGSAKSFKTYEEARLYVKSVLDNLERP